MSTPDDPPSSHRYSGGQMVMIGIGVILLLPGACSLIFMLLMFSELRRGDPYIAAVASVWVVCFFASAAGGALIYVARKDARAAASGLEPDGNPRP